MHYYKRNIGDYHKKAGRLSILQHGVYTLLIDSCYDREVFPTLDEAIDWVWASSTEEIEATQFVLKKLFTLEDGVYIQKTIKADLEHYQSKSITNKRVDIEREAKRKEKETKRARNVNESTPNHKPLTINQEPVTNNQKPITQDLALEIENDQSEIDRCFDGFWCAGMQKKGGKDYTKKKFIAILNKLKGQTAGEFTAMLCQDIRARLDAPVYGFNNLTPSTYLSKKRWTDEITTNQETGNPKKPDFDDTNNDWAVDALNGKSGIMF